MIIYNQFNLKVCDMWFEYEKPPPDVDLVRVYQLPQKPENMHASRFTTLTLDLQHSTSDLYSNFGKYTRKKISRAERKDNLTYDFFSEEFSPIELFWKFYLKVRKRKSGPFIHRNRLLAYANSNTLYFSRVMRHGRTMTWHCYIKHGQRIRHLYSINNLKKTNASLAGRAHRYAHWQDIITFKKQGFLLYDLGGWYTGHNDRKLLNINSFKAEFGGKKLVEWNSEFGNTLAGKTYMPLKKTYLILRRIRNINS